MHSWQSGPIAKEVAKILAEIRRQWFPLPPKSSWPRKRRFLICLVGSSTFCVTIPVIRLSDTELIEDAILFDFDIWVLIVSIGLIVSLWFAYLASWSDQARGPVRLFFSGLLLPALTMFVIVASLG